jgi:D-alanine-D-alanine ligase
MKEKVLVVCGGQSTEHSISRMSCTSVLQHLNTDNYEITLVGIDTDGQWYQLDTKITDVTADVWLENSVMVTDVFGLVRQHDVILPMLHGLYGEDGTIQGLFELADVPYVGARVLGSSVAMDKIYAKKIFETAGIPQAPSLYIKKRYDGKLVVVDNDFEERENVAEIVGQTLGYPCFVKASNSGSSVGCYRVDSAKTLLSKLQEASAYDRKIVVEKNIDCIELECAVLGNDDPIASRVGQIMPHGEFYTFESKYEDEESKTYIPALVDASIQERIRELAITTFKAIDGHGLSRVDFFLDKQTNALYLNEINTLPGFTNISMYPKLMEDFGISYSELLDRLIDLAKEK